MGSPTMQRQIHGWATTGLNSEVLIARPGSHGWCGSHGGASFTSFPERACPSAEGAEGLQPPGRRLRDPPLLPGQGRALPGHPGQVLNGAGGGSRGWLFLPSTGQLWGAVFTPHLGIESCGHVGLKLSCPILPPLPFVFHRPYS